MDITWIINGTNFGDKLSTYRVDKEIAYQDVITTMDGTEHPVGKTSRTILRFSLLPMTEFESKELENVFRSMVFDVTYPQNDGTKTETFRLDSDLNSIFLLKSIDGKRRYRGDEIVLRGVYSARG